MNKDKIKRTRYIAKTIKEKSKTETTQIGKKRHNKRKQLNILYHIIKKRKPQKEKEVRNRDKKIKKN